MNCQGRLVTYSALEAVDNTQTSACKLPEVRGGLHHKAHLVKELTPLRGISFGGRPLRLSSPRVCGGAELDVNEWERDSCEVRPAMSELVTYEVWMGRDRLISHDS